MNIDSKYNPTLTLGENSKKVGFFMPKRRKVRKRLSVVSAVVLISSLLAVPAFPVSFEIDIGGDGSFETGQTINISPQTAVIADLYMDGYECPPDDLFFGTTAYIALDESKGLITSCLSYTTDHGGPFDPTLSGCNHHATDVHLMASSKFGFVHIVGGRQKFGILEIEFHQNDEYLNLIVAEDLTAYGYPLHNDAFASDCNLASFIPDEAVVTMIRTTLPPCLCDFNGDGRVGLADLVLMKQEFLRYDCVVNPCQADCNGDGRVDLADLLIIKEEFTWHCLETP